MNYKEIYNELKDATNNFTNESGIFNVQTRSELATAIDILKQSYNEVNNLGLDFRNKDSDGLNYRVEYTNKINSIDENLDSKLGEHNNMGNVITKNECTFNVDEAIEKHDTLNPDLWDDNNELRPEVKEKLEDIVKHFDEALKNDGVELDILDIVIIGSNASYNYNDASDIDLHIIADTSVYTDEDLALKLYQAYKSLFNNKYDPTIRNHEVEIYVEPYEVHANSKGIYSLKDGWLKEPENVDIPEIEQEEVEEYLAPFKERFDEVINSGSLEDVDQLIDDIYLERQSSIIKEGEFAIPNLAFKEFRAQGYLQKLRDRKVELENDAMSIEENDNVKESIFNLFVDDNSFKHTNESLTKNDFSVGDVLSNGRDEIEILEVNDDNVLYNYNPLNSNRYTANDPIDSFTHMINNFDFSKKLKEDLEEVGQGVEFLFPEVEDTLNVFLAWEGILGYTYDILDYQDTTKEDLESFLSEEGIYGYTEDIWDILQGGKAFISPIDSDEFYRLCYENGVNPSHATLYDSEFNEGETITEDLPDLPDWLPKDDPNYTIRDIVKKAKERNFDLERVFSYELRDGKLKDIDDFSFGGKHYKRSGRGWIITLDNGNTISATNTGAADDMAKFFQSGLKEDLDDLIGDRDTGSREIKTGINWTWFWTDNKNDAIRWFKQLIGKLPYESTLVKDGSNWGFRIKNDNLDDLKIIDDSNEWVCGNNPNYLNDESLDEDDNKKIKARIARTDEFDNGKVFFNYSLMTNSEAEERAKKASIEYPNKIFYVKYDDIMNPSSDLKWVNGKSYTTYNDALKASRLNLDESYMDNSDDYVKDQLKNDLLYNYKIKPADIVKKGNDFLIVFFTKEDKDTVYNRPDMLSPVRIKGELCYPYRFGSIDINAMRKANNPKYDRIIREYDEYILQKKYNDFTIHSIDDVAEDELDEALNESIEVVNKDEVYYEPSTNSLIKVFKVLPDTTVNYKVVPNGDETESFATVEKYDYLLNELNRYGYKLLNYELVNNEKASWIIDKRDPIGKFIEINGTKYIAIDNSTGDAWVEEFNSLSDAVKYLDSDDSIINEKIVKKDNKYQVQSEKGRNMGTYDTKKEAEDRLKEVEMFKHMNEELDEGDVRGEALANYLGLTNDDLDYIGSDRYETENQESIYFVVTKDEAKYYVKEIIEDIIFDVGPTAFTKDFQKFIYNECVNEKDVNEFIDNEINYFNSIEDEQDMVDYLKGLNTGEKVQYIIDTLGKDDFNDWLFLGQSKIDFDKLVDEAIKKDGVAHFLASYDHKEIDLGNGLFAYRIY